jgi:subfamily B ATP-binding cassette protein MsbA
MKPLLDSGFGQSQIALWSVPAVIIGVFIVRATSSFAAAYALAWTSNQGVLNLRRSMFDRLLDAHPTLFTRHTAS